MDSPMNVVGIIAEYNPFHKGHKYQLEQAKSASNAEYSIAVMSGNFVQRGEGAILDKFKRTKAAILSGVDLIIELPCDFAVQTAERFAFGGIYLLNALNITTHLSFGCEHETIEDLQKTAEFLIKDDSGYNMLIKADLDKGHLFASCRQRAVSQILGASYGKILSSPNNILAVEYLKALIKQNSAITPVPVKRVGADHDSTDSSGSFSSAKNIRQIIKTAGIYPAEPYLTLESFAVLKENSNYAFCDHFDQMLLYSILSSKNLSAFPDVSEGLDNRIKAFAATSSSAKELIEKIKTKRYTYTRISRILTNHLLGIRQCDLSDTPKYIRVLGFNEKGRFLLNKIKKKASLPIITRPASAYSLPASLLSEIELDFKAFDIYNLANGTFANKKGRADVLSTPVILP